MIYWRNLAEGFHTESFRNCQRHVAYCAAVLVVAFQWHLSIPCAKICFPGNVLIFHLCKYYTTSQPLKAQSYLYVPPAITFDSYLFCSDTFYVLITTNAISLNLRKKNTGVHLTYTGCNRRNGPDFGRIFLMLNYTEKPQDTYIQS